MWLPGPQIFPSWTVLRCRLCGVLLLAASAATSLAQQTAGASPGTGIASVLQQRYDAAQRFQASKDLAHAAQQYAVFLADAHGQIALGRAHAGQYEQAATHFDEALRLVPEFPAMRLAYARAALANGALEHARLLAEQVIASDHDHPKQLAEAHGVLGRVLLKQDKDQQAKTEFESAVALDPTFENGYELAIAELDLGEKDQVQKLFAEMLSSFGDTAVIHMYFGQAYGNSDFQAQALEEFRKAQAKDDRLPGLHYSLAAVQLTTSGDAGLAEAQAELRKEIAIDPESATAYAALGHLLARSAADPARLAEALQMLNRAASLDPSNPDTFFFLGEVYTNAGKPAEAAEALRHSIALTHDVARNGYQVQKAHYMLGRLLMQSGQADEGRQQLAASQALTKQKLASDEHRLNEFLQATNEAHAEAAAVPMLLSASQPALDKTAAAKTDALEKVLSPAMADSYNNLGAIYGSQGRYADAVQSFEQAAVWNSGLPGLDFNWGRAAFAAGQPAQAVGPLRRFVAAHPDDQGARTVLGLSQFLSDDFAAARATLQPLAARPDLAPQVRFAYAESLVKTGERSDGLARLNALEAADPKVADVHRALGEAYATTDAKRATEELETALRLNPEDARSHTSLAQLELEHGQPKEAVAHLQQALKLHPGDVTLASQLARATQQADMH